MSYKVIEPDGEICYYKDCNYTILHRTDGPAVISAHRTTWWYTNGKRHRIDGPAIEWSNRDESWFRYGKLHRLDGPAISNLWSIIYRVNGVKCTITEFPKLVARWVSYVEVTKADIETVIGKYRITEW